MARIYRVEKPDDLIGPYNGRCGMINNAVTHKHPAPNFSVPAAFRFGFISLDKALEWFYDELDILSEHGFVISEIDAPIVAIDDYQCAFVERNAVRVNQIKI